MTAYDKLSRKDLKALPERRWPDSGKYDSLIMFPSNCKHDSGWGAITLIGCRDMAPVEILTQYSDDIKFNDSVSVDCLYRAKAFHIWRQNYRFEVPPTTSSLYIKLEKELT